MYRGYLRYIISFTCRTDIRTSGESSGSVWRNRQIFNSDLFDDGLYLELPSSQARNVSCRSRLTEESFSLSTDQRRAHAQTISKSTSVDFTDSHPYVYSRSDRACTCHTRVHVRQWNVYFFRAPRSLYSRIDRGCAIYTRYSSPQCRPRRMRCWILRQRLT